MGDTYEAGEVEFINNPNDPTAIYYRKKKLLLDPDYINKTYEMAKEFKNERTHNNGFSKDKSLRWHGSVPAKIWYDRINESGDPDYWRRDKHRNYKKFINENPVFRNGDSLV